MEEVEARLRAACAKSSDKDEEGPAATEKDEKLASVMKVELMDATIVCWRVAEYKAGAVLNCCRDTWLSTCDTPKTMTAAAGEGDGVEGGRRAVGLGDGLGVGLRVFNAGAAVGSSP